MNWPCSEAKHILNRASLLRERLCPPDSRPYQRITELLKMEMALNP